MKIISPTCFACLVFSWLFSGCGTSSEEGIGSHENWEVSLGDKFSSQYSHLDQINRKNLDRLELAWTFRSGDLTERRNTQIQCNPIIVDGVLFGSTPTMKAVALDAGTGKLLWEFDPKKDFEVPITVNRGLTYFRDGSGDRVFFSAGSFLFALNAQTGQLVRDFGDSGKVSLKEGLGDWAKDLYVISTSPGIIFEDKIIVGTRVSENNDAAPGYVRAFNAFTGALDWVFHTIPRPGEYGYDTWPVDSYQRAGGANSWSGFSLDEKRGMVFVPTGSASFDFWGGNRLGDNLFSNSVIALNAATGERIWHYQTVRHDMWDRDLPAPPNLVRVVHSGKTVDAVAQITKTGRVFVFNRETGDPLFPIEEMDVPLSDLMGEVAAASQPLPVLPPPFARQVFTDEEVTDISPESGDYVREMLKGKRYGHMYMPPSTEGTVVFPGFDGGGEWGGAAFDPTSGWLYVNANEMPWIHTMVPTFDQAGAGLGKSVYMVNCGMCHGPAMAGDPTGDYPSLIGVGGRLASGELVDIITKGKGRMPGFQHLKEAEREAVLAYINRQEGSEVDAHEEGMESNLGAVPYTHTGYHRFFDQDGYPAVKPPWGTLSAIDLNKGEISWQVPLGEFKELTERGIPKTGTENYGGPVVTAGGLVFIGASKDEYFRVFDKVTGEELWKYKLPAAGYATPAVYAVNGKQYVVIAAGGGKIGTDPGDYYLAFALKD
ncbi:PQQ-binding-like beta-propeller repeat protein [Lunatimonas salinarum]|uniref:outer membrane protein assembly factor BamB family protein n=1 Tax=Lunatimonas salinarum TaxID=1774590 RepID=UPI001ADFFFB9|nr:PQQ-binding-like beta-propeller repeat protein [Lunatimonas salinarum]